MSFSCLKKFGIFEKLLYYRRAKWFLMKKYQRFLLAIGLVADALVTLFFFVISIIMLAMIGKYGDPKEAAANAKGLFLFLLENTSVYFWAFVFPLFVLLVANIVGLVLYVKKTSAKESTPTKLDDLSEEQKEALRQELLKDLMKDSQNNKEE